MSVYLSLGHREYPWLLGIYKTEQELRETRAGTDPYFEKKDVCHIDEETGEITFSDGSRLKLSASCDHCHGRDRDIELDYDYEPAATK